MTRVTHTDDLILFQANKEVAARDGDIRAEEFESLPLPSVRDDGTVAVIFTLYLLYVWCMLVVEELGCCSDLVF